MKFRQGDKVVFIKYSVADHRDWEKEHFVLGEELVVQNERNTIVFFVHKIYGLDIDQIVSLEDYQKIQHCSKFADKVNKLIEG